MPWQRGCVHSGIYHREVKNGDEVMEGRPEVINKLRRVVSGESQTTGFKKDRAKLLSKKHKCPNQEFVKFLLF